MFVDDNPLERDEVQSEHPEVLCVDASQYDSLLAHPCLNPRFITADSKRRRLMYLEDIKRKRDENEYQGPKKEFIASLNIQFIISQAKEEDLQRAEELTIRTNQLNATGRTYSYDDLRMFISSGKHQLLICEMKDKYGFELQPDSTMKDEKLRSDEVRLVEALVPPQSRLSPSGPTARTS